MSDVAYAGPLRPPLIYLVAIIAGVVIQPIPFVPAALAIPVGAAFVVLAIALFVSSVLKFRAAGTPVPAREPTTAIVRTGPFGFSRNPIYLAFSLLQLGIAIWTNNAWLLLTLAAAVAVMNWVVIPREERYLERRFGAEYSAYRSAVRRWL
jgi:protein-S-isoprenylcysteine O-methyltransferase Ste14